MISMPTIHGVALLMFLLLHGIVCKAKTVE